MKNSIHSFAVVCLMFGAAAMAQETSSTSAPQSATAQPATSGASSKKAANSESEKSNHNKHHKGPMGKKKAETDKSKMQ